MKKQSKTLNDIQKMDSLALTGIINYWKNYSIETPMLAIEELKKREYNIAEDLQRRIDDYMNKNDLTEIEKSKITSQSEEGKSNLNNIRNSGRAIKNIVWVIVGMFLVSLVLIFIVMNLTDYTIIKVIYGIFSFVILVGNVIIMYLLYQAGDYLENSIE
jgi:hypothetical protein